MGAQLREYRQRIRAAQTTKKITRAMELISASRIQKAQARVAASGPYSRAVTRAVSAVATFSNVNHILTTEPEKVTRAAVVLFTSDRGLNGAFSSNIVRESGELVARLTGEGKEVIYYVVGRKGAAYFAFRQRPIEQLWTGGTDQPEFATAQDIGTVLVDKFIQDESEGGVNEIHIVYNRFKNVVTQIPEIVRLLPLEVVEGTDAPEPGDLLPAYEFEPDAEHRARHAAPRLHREPHLQRDAAVRGIRARGTPARDARGERQRRQARPELHPTGEQRPPVRDHPADFRDRRRRRRPLGQMNQVT